MNLKISKRDFVEYVILIALVFQIFIVKWLDLTIRYSYIIIFLLFFHFILNLKRYGKLSSVLFTLFLIIIYVLLNVKLLGKSQNILNNNLKMILPSLFILPFVSYMLVYKRKVIEKFLLKSILIFNLYYIINIPVIIFELKGMTSLAGRHPSNIRYTLIEDMGSGLLGYYGTPILGLFFAFMMIYNMYYSRYIGNKNKRRIFKAYNILMFICMIWLSTQNDNKGAIFISFIFIGVYKFFTNIDNLDKKITSKVINTLKYTLSVCIAGGISFWIISKIPALNSAFEAIIARVQEGIDLGVKATGSAERIGALVFILTDSEHKYFGYGIGNYGWRQSNAFGLYNFGQSDLSVLIILGGIVLLLLLLLILFFTFLSSSKNICLSTVLVVFFAILNIYTQVITEPSAMYIFVLFSFVCIQSSGFKNVTVE